IIPVIINHSFLDNIAKITPSMESPVNTLIINVKFALGPLMIKKKMMLIITVIIDNTPKIFLFLSKIYNLLFIQSFVQYNGPFAEHLTLFISYHNYSYSS